MSMLGYMLIDGLVFPETILESGTLPKRRGQLEKQKGEENLRRFCSDLKTRKSERIECTFTYIVILSSGRQYYTFEKKHTSMGTTFIHRNRHCKQEDQRPHLKNPDT